MPPAKTITFGSGKTYSLDRHGFLDPPDQWDQEFAESMARLHGIYGGLTSEHWQFIHYIRNKFLQEDDLPLLVRACADNRLRLSRLKELFPTGYLRGACRIAGLSFQFLCNVNLWHTYESLPRIKQEYKISEQGFLEHFEDWDERFAQLISADWNLPEGLTDKHWQIIRFLRNYYTATNTIPIVYEVCQAHALDLQDLYSLFPEGYRRGACRIAGLPFFA